MKTDNQQQNETQPYPSYTELQAPPPDMTPRRKRGKGKFFAIGCGSLVALVVLIIVIAAVASAGGNSPNSPSTVTVTDTPTSDTQQNPQNAQEVATANAVSNGTPAAGACGSKCGPPASTPQAQSSTPPPVSTPQAPAAPAYTYSGNGSKTTETFSVSDTWTITWTCDATNNYGVDGAMYVAIYDSQNNLIDLLSETCTSGVTSKGVSQEHQGGDVYLKIDGSVPWTLKVTEV
jgi:hypothetical protein